MSNEAPNQTAALLWIAPYGVDAYWQGRTSHDKEVCPYVSHTIDAIRWRFGRSDRANGLAEGENVS